MKLENYTYLMLGKKPLDQREQEPLMCFVLGDEEDVSTFYDIAEDVAYSAKMQKLDNGQIMIMVSRTVQDS